MPSPTCRDYNASTDDLGASCIVATMRVGNNSATPGTLWEHLVNNLPGQYRWGAVEGYLNSGEVSCNLTVNEGGGANSVTWVLGTADTITYGGKTYGNIQKVGIQALVAKNPNDPNPGELISKWTELTVGFFDSDGVGSEFVAGSGCLPQAKMSGTRNVIKIIEPGDNNQVRIVVVGKVYLESQDPARPDVPSLGANQIMLRIFVWANNCANA